MKRYCRHVNFYFERTCSAPISDINTDFLFILFSTFYSESKLSYIQAQCFLTVSLKTRFFK